MEVFISKEGFYLPSLNDFTDELSGGVSVINGVSYDIHLAEVKDVPDDAKDRQYIVKEGQLTANPDFKDDASDVRSLAKIVLELKESIAAVKSDLDVLKKADK